LKALEIADKVKKVIEPVLESKGFELVDVEYRREPVGMVLRVFIDQPEGVDLKACSDASALIDSGLDEVDIVPDVYNLEVSSPGVERRLTKPEHFKRFVGRQAQVRTAQVVDGRKKYTGRLTDVNETGFSLDMDEGSRRFEYKEIAKANLKYTD